MERQRDIDRLYHLLEKLEETVGGKQKLKDCTGYMDWPDRGVYFFLHQTNTATAATSFGLLASGLTLSPREAVPRSGTDSEHIAEQRGEPTKAAGTTEAPSSGNESAKRSLSVIP